MSGPLPNPNARRRNAPTIKGTVLPATGRRGRPPNPPYDLGTAGRSWWRWAWQTPQATAWDDGAWYAAGRRAQLEDDLSALDAPEAGLDLAALLGADDDNSAVKRLEAVMRRLKSLAGGRVTVVREMRELDKRLGLDPKALAELRWTIAAPEDTAEGVAPQVAASRRLRAVDA